MVDHLCLGVGSRGLVVMLAVATAGLPNVGLATERRPRNGRNPVGLGN
jgi:hypothetical protein